jgi:hypothetical protein
MIKDEKKMKKVYRNIGILDIRETSDETIQDIDSFRNIGTILYSRKTAHLLTKLTFRNLGSTIEIPENAQLFTGQMTINNEDLENATEPLNMFITGQVIFGHNVTVENAEKKIGNLGVTGQILCPDRISGILKSKMKNFTGQMVPYPEGSQVIVGKISIDDSYLKAISTPRGLTVIGKVDVTSQLDINLLDEKLTELYIVGSLAAKEEYMEVLNRKMKERAITKVTTYPAGYTIVKNLDEINANTIKQFNNAKLYFSEMVLFDKNITPESLKQHISSLILKEGSLCHEDLYPHIQSLCHELCGKVLTYSGKPIMIEGEHLLTQEELEYAPDKLTYVIKGEMEIDEKTDPELMIKKIEHVDNFGEIKTAPRQYGALQAILRTRSGEVSRESEDSENEPESQEQGVRNVGYLKL